MNKFLDTLVSSGILEKVRDALDTVLAPQSTQEPQNNYGSHITELLELYPPSEVFWDLIEDARGQLNLALNTTCSTTSLALFVRVFSVTETSVIHWMVDNKQLQGFTTETAPDYLIKSGGLGWAVIRDLVVDPLLPDNVMASDKVDIALAMRNMCSAVANGNIGSRPLDILEAGGILTYNGTVH